MDRATLYHTLERFVKGEVPCADAKRLAASEGFASFAELCEGILPDRIVGLRLTRRLVAERARACLAGKVATAEIGVWAEEIYTIAFNHELRYERGTEDLVTGALSSLSVVCNDRIFTRADKTRGYLARIADCLRTGERIHTRDIFPDMFFGLEVVHFANKNDVTGENEDDSYQWADVVVLDAPFVAGKDLYLDYNWLVAFSVATRDLYEEEGASGRLRRRLDVEEAAPRDALSADEERATVRPVAEIKRRPKPPPDRIAEVRGLVLNFDLARYRPAFSYDKDGLAEIVLDTERILAPEVLYATKLFALANRIGSCHLEGKVVKTLRVAEPML